MTAHRGLTAFAVVVVAVIAALLTAVALAVVDVFIYVLRIPYNERGICQPPLNPDWSSGCGVHGLIVECTWVEKP